MKLLISAIIALTVLLQSITGTIMVIKFQLQKKYIIEKLCENRNKPSNGCGGKCYLKKLLKETEEAEKALPGSIKEKMEVAYILNDLVPLSFEIQDLYVLPQYSYYFILPESPVFTEFLPPRV